MLYFCCSFMVNVQYIIVNPSTKTWHTSWWFFPTREWKNKNQIGVCQKKKYGVKKIERYAKKKKHSPIEIPCFSCKGWPTSLSHLWQWVLQNVSLVSWQNGNGSLSTWRIVPNASQMNWENFALHLLFHRRLWNCGSGSCGGNTWGIFVAHKSIHLHKWKKRSGWWWWWLISNFNPSEEKKKNFPASNLSQSFVKPTHHLHPWKSNMEVENQPLEMETSIVKLAGERSCSKSQEGKRGNDS